MFVEVFYHLLFSYYNLYMRETGLIGVCHALTLTRLTSLGLLTTYTWLETRQQ
jgi:hypothetical protein